ncbi:serine/threonine-protein kinase [Haliangium sp. UPWRP_2]|uniref:serine/threonine-protein kinase n=1 Tax=Haliangium sp. UPWRP_2 TaxID=1931276 RepID=UPI000B541F41|nr:serine/threonine-protein kinase [Haliangium sp. UPWRP_2]PSM31581.1 serine/threonine protein kinase [Haliangium sp. UPWRP_2]
MAHSPLEPGKIVGAYRILAKIGEGGMGAVYECVHTTIDRRAVLKVVRQDLSSLPGVAARFFNEARAANRVQHSGVVQVFDCGQTEDGTLYLLMEFVDGETLHARLNTARGAPPYVLGLDALPLLHQLASILAAAHKQKIVHRDLKPSNVMLVADPSSRGGDRVRLLDFGIAKVLVDALDQNPQGPRTETGMILGTPSYMAPEQAKSAATVNDRADVYALGVIAYEALVGRLPITADSAFAVLFVKSTMPPAPLRQHDPGLPPDLERLVMSMLEIDPAARPSAAEVERELADMLGLSVPRRSRLSGSISGPTAPPTASAADPTLDSPLPSAGKASGAPQAQVVSAPAQAQAVSAPVPVAVPSAPSYKAPVAVALPSAPTVRSPRRTAWVAAVLAVTTVGAMSVFWFQRSKPSPDPSPPHLVSAAPDMAELQRPDAQPPVAAQTPNTAAPTEDNHAAAATPATGTHSRGKERSGASACSTPRPACVTGKGISESLRPAVAESFAEAQIRLCSGERVLLELDSREVVLVDAPTRMDKDDRLLLRAALRSRLPAIDHRISVEVRCKR